MDAWIHLGFAHVQAIVFSDGKETFDRAEAAFLKVVECSPGSQLALAARAVVALFKWDYLTVDKCLAEGLELSGAMLSKIPPLAYFFVVVGRHREALEAYARLLRTDPLISLEMIQHTLSCARRTEEAKAEFNRLFKIIPNPARCEWHELLRVMAEEDRDAAGARLRRYLSLNDGFMPVYGPILEKFEDRDAVLALLHDASRDEFYQDFRHLQGIAYFAAYFGDDDLALACLRRSLVDMRGILINAIWHPLFARLRRTAGFKQLLHDLGISDYWRKSGHWGDFARPLGADDFEVIA